MIDLCTVFMNLSLTITMQAAAASTHAESGCCWL
jgi:hypothetical protein